MKNFGFVDEITVVAPGINGKMSEINAAFGLLQLNHIDSAIASRKIIYDIYFKELFNINGINLLIYSESSTKNYSYFPIIVTEDYQISRDELYEKLKSNNIFARRYFYPLISEMPMYRSLTSSKNTNLPVASIASRQILCLPIHPGLTLDQQMKIIDLIK